MNLVINIVAIGLSIFLLSIPLINRYGFHTVNVDEIIVAGRDGLSKISELQRLGRLDESRDSARTLIDRFTSDSIVFSTYDVVNWPQAAEIAAGKSTLRWAHLITDYIDEDDAKEYAAASDTKPLSYDQKNRIVSVLNQTVENDQLYVTFQDSLTVDRIAEAQLLKRQLVDAKVFIEAGGRVTLKQNPSAAERKVLRRFHEVIVEKTMFPQILKKDLKKGKDWASEFIVQTAIYNIGASYKAAFNTEDAVKTWNGLIEKYPGTIYAEVLFLQIGQALYSDGLRAQNENQTATAEAQYHEAIHYLEKLERNREISRQFPKYKFADLNPGVYVNVDATAKAKARVRQKTSLYTTKQAEMELSGKSADDRTGYFLEDAVKQIGQCYLQLGSTDSARAELKLILDFFPESDNLPETQKLIADSYVKDGDLLKAKGDTASAQVRGKIDEDYRLAVKEYLKFINVYPQSNLISEAFISLGDAYNKLREPQNASAAFASALGRAKEAEDQAKVQLKIGNYYYERKRFAEAVEAYQVILKNFLSTEVAPNAQYMLGESYLTQGDTAKAIENYKVILDHYKQSAFLGSAAYKIGNAYFDKANYKEAFDAYKDGYVYDPDGNLNSKTKLKMGLVWRKIADGQEGEQKAASLNTAIKQFDELVKRFQGLVGKDEDADQASFQLAECYLALDNEKAAREAAKKIGNRDLLLRSVKLFNPGSGDNGEEEAKYWAQAFSEAMEDEERATALYEKAQVLCDKLGKYDEALEAYTKALSLTHKESKKTNAKVGMTKVYNAEKRYAEAESTYTELIADPHLSTELRQQLQVQLYDAYFKAGDHDKAYEGFDRFATQYPEHNLAPYAYYRLGTILADTAKKEYQKAMDKYQVILDKYKTSDMYDKAVLGIGEQMANLEKYREAVNYLEDYVKKNANAPTAVNMLMKIGDLYEKKLSSPQEAVKAFGQVINDYADKPYFSYACYQQGMVLKELGQEDKALAVFGKVKKEDKSVYRAAQAEIGKIIAKTDPARAIENYKRIVEESETPEDSAIATIGIGDVYASTKAWDKAAATYKQVYDFYHGADTNLVAGALVKECDALMNAKKYTDAIVVAQLMQKTYPENGMTINTMYFEASAYFALERFAQARVALDRIIAANKSDQLTEIAYYQKGDSYYFAKEYAAAIPKYDEYVSKYPKGKFVARSLNMQGNAYVSLQEFGKAKAKFQQIVNDYPTFDDICMTKNYLALSLNQQGDWKLAVRYYDQVIKGGACTGKVVDFARQQRELIVGAH